MAISKYEENGKTFWKVYVCIASTENPTKRVQRRLSGIESEALAFSEEKRLLREAATALSKLDGKGLSWEEVIGRWELAMRREGAYFNYAPTTIIDHANTLYRWTEDWLKRPAGSLTRGDGRDVLRKMELANKSRNFRKNVKYTINVVFKWALEEHLIKGVNQSPVEGVQLGPVTAEKVPDILTIEEIRKLLSSSKQLENPWYPVWAMALLTGMRSGELHALTWSDVDLDGRRITVSKSYNTRFRRVESTKARYWRTVPISDELHILLQSLKTDDPKRLSVLPRFWEWDKGAQARCLRMFCQGIGIRPIKFHALRACFATQLLANDIAPARVMKICGWRDLKTMQYYVRLAGIEEAGATQVLRILPSDAAVMGEVVNLFEFKAKKNED